MPRNLFSVILCGILLGFFLISKTLFDKVFLTSKFVIDEEFHIPQGLAYCNFTFNTWNPKLTTLPGLYLVSALIMGPLNLCSIYWLRFVNLLASVLNLWLIYVCFGLYNKQNSWLNLLSSVNLSILPPLYFFSHLYYTDVVSVTFILLLTIYNKKEKHITASIFGLMSVLMRQTNIIWLIMVFGQYVLREILGHSKRQSRRRTQYDDTLSHIIKTVWNLKDGIALKKFPLHVWLNISAYLAVLLSFFLFVFINDGIVVGDKTAHEASLHLPQIFYFSVFCLVFAWPYFVVDVVDFTKCVGKSLKMVIFVVVICAVVVYFDTLEHPYLLADNRHYTFYIWSRFYGKYFWFRYLMIPVYCFAIFGLLQKIYTKYNVIFVLTYLSCVVLVLIPQKMIEIRYFLVPYMFLRFQFKIVVLWQLLAELVFYCVLNVLTFHIFFTKDIYWSDFSDVQRLIW